MAAAMVVGSSLPAFSDQPCRQALILGLDVSGSVDEQEYRLQIDGLAAALSNAKVRERILAMPAAPIRLAVFEWSGPRAQYEVLPWTSLDTNTAIDRAVARIAAQTRQTQNADATAGNQATALGSAMRFAQSRLASQRHCWQRTVDISGDGKHNTGPDPQILRDRMEAEGIIVNGLVIGADNPAFGDTRSADIGELSSYYNAFVITRPTGFVITALGFQDFERAMVTKLIREISVPVLGQAPAPQSIRPPDQAAHPVAYFRR
ncbi:DUF1194 domain-containing protein [Shimia ponticola]|uniref:DUF1194 domain-containing protein n=1 Tax=Shimia ponticola TaxID=2582893 RepID=UPI0011BE2FC8|nr:DUF1194 domain-containing protein [Shimia ponticola]